MTRCSPRSRRCSSARRISLCDVALYSPHQPSLTGAGQTLKGTPMSTVTLLDEIDDLERLLAGAHASISTSSKHGEWLRAADDDEDEDDLFGEDDVDADEDLDEDLDEEL